MVTDLVARLKELNQDHEFYPTTREIIDTVISDLETIGQNFYSILDIGAGNGKVLSEIKKAEHLNFNKFFAIEKSSELRYELPPEVFVVGTDFLQQSLLSKQVDITFCNPPYSEFETWAVKVLRETTSDVVYFVLPERWKWIASIGDAMEYREWKVKLLGEFDFLSSEDRKARAKVQVLRFHIKLSPWRNGSRSRQDPLKDLKYNQDSAFRTEFSSQFKDFIAKFKESNSSKTQDTVEQERRDQVNALVPAVDYPTALVQLYNTEMSKIQHNYSLVTQLDVSLLAEFGIVPDKVMECLYMRLSGLKNDYWSELFDRFHPLTERLTEKCRRKLLDTLKENTGVDFTVDNIHAVVEWALKNSNQCIDEQLLSTYRTMIEKANIILYKSNQRVLIDDEWRYLDRTHFSLNYRLVLQHVGGISEDIMQRKCKLHKRAVEFIEDIRVVGSNLGFTRTNKQRADDFLWNSGKSQVFECKDLKTGEVVPLLEVKAFQNGNLHIRLHKRFALALNVEFGRLNGWLRTPKEAVEELQDKEAASVFKSNFQLIGGASLLQLTA